MNIDFAFEETVRASRKEAENYKLDNVKGISYPSLGYGYINLSSTPWYDYLERGFSNFREELTKTIVHEYIHLLIGTKASPNDEPNGYTWRGEECVCRLLSNQDTSKDYPALVGKL